MTNKIFKLFILLLVSTAISCATAGVKKLDDGRKVYTTKKDSKLSSEPVISGYILDSKTKKPITNAKVEMKNANLGMGYYLRETDSTGYYEIKGFIPQVKYIVEISATGYVSHKSKSHITPGEKKIFLDREAIVSGQVTNSLGKTLAGVEVKIKRGYSYGYSYRSRKPLFTKTDNNGRYSFNKLTRSSYHVYFSKPGYIAETVSIKYVKMGETFSLPMKLYRPASISGKIKIRGLNVPAVNVYVVAKKGRRSHSASTYQDGSFQIDDVKPGEYKINVSHEGFYKLGYKYLHVREGMKIKNYNFSVVPKSPELKVYAYRYTFAPGSKVSFNLRTFRLESYNVTVYKVPINTFLKGRTDPDYINPGKEKFKAAVKWKETVRDFKPYKWRYQTLEVKDALPTGGYCIEVKGPGGIVNRKFFTVTSVGVVVKRSQYSISAYISNLVTSKPIPGARIIVFDSTPVKKRYRYSRYTYKPPKRIEDLPVDVLYKGKSGKDGMYIRKSRSTRHLSLMAIGKDGSYAICSTGSPTVFQREKYKYLIYTERPVYRAGDTVYYKIIGKKREGRFVPRAGEMLYYKIRNRDTNKTFKEGRVTLDDWGTAHSKIKIPADGSLGVYEIRVGPKKKNLYASGRFYVEQYRKPEFKIDITPSRDYFINGDTVKFKVEGKYFFGAPLKGALVHYRFYETKLRDTDTLYWWEEDGASSRSYNRLKLEGDKYLDENGIAALTLDSGIRPFDREITLEVTIVDKSNISITSQGRVKVGRGEYYVKINPALNFFSSRDKKKINLKALTHTGKPVRVKLKLELYRYIWKPYQRVYVHEKRPVYSKNIRTDKNGKAEVMLPEKFSSYGEFDIIVTGSDRRNNVITASRVIWIYDYRGGRVASRFKNLELSVNKKVLNKPGNITCLLKSRFPGAYVYLTLEGKDIYMSRVVKLKGNIMPVTIPVKASYAPNFYITATMQRKRALFTSTKSISLPIKDIKLKVTIKPGKEKYKPGEKASVDIIVTDMKGGPLKSDLSLSAVDESIYYIRRDHTPAMGNFFYTKISNWVLTGYSYPITVLAGAGKEGKVKIREKFEDTAFWKANIRTNSNGRARVTFKLPDNLTTWRLTARGHDKKGRVGENKKNFLVTQDLIARIGRPRFFIEGDDVGLIGIVNSNTKRGLPRVKMDFKVNGKTIPPVKKLDISLPAFGSARSFHKFKIPEKKDKVHLQLEVVADRDAIDGLLLKVPVEKRGSKYLLFGYGDMKNNKRLVLSPIKESDDFKFVPEDITISLNPTPVLQMLKATKYLVNYPYGCVEQTINKFIPVLAIHRLLKDKNYSNIATGKAGKDLPKKVKTGISRLQQMQNYDGSWGWWSGDRGNEFLSSYAMYSLYLARGYGYTIGKNPIKRGLKALSRMLNSPNVKNPDAKALLLYVYSCYGKWDQKAYNSLLKVKNKSAYQSAFMIRALAKHRPNRRYKSSKNFMTDKMRAAHLIKLKKELMGEHSRDDKGIYWKSRGYQRWGWPGRRTEITAHVLSALVEAGDRSAVPARIVRSLSRRSRGSRWSTTKQTATVILAMTEYMKNSEKITGEAVKVDFTFDGNSVANFKYDPNMMNRSKDLVKKIKISDIKTRKEIEILATGKAGKDASFDVTVSGILYYKPGGFLSIFKSEDRGLERLSNGIQLFRRFSGIKRIRDLHRNEYLMPQKFSDKMKITVGDEILVKIKFRADDNFEYLVLEDFLPSGFEVIKKNAYDGYSPYSRVERWDNRMVFFFNKLTKGKIYEVAYILRAELPGKFMARPARLGCMYEPSIQGWSAPTIIEVQPK